MSGGLIKQLVRDNYVRDWCLFPPDGIGNHLCPRHHVRVRIRGTSDIAIWVGSECCYPELRETKNNITKMIESKIDELIAALAANTAALTGKAPTKADKAADPKKEDKKAVVDLDDDEDKKDEPEITIATLREKAKKLVDAEMGDKVKAILEHYEAPKLAQLDKSKFAKVDAKFSRLLEKVKPKTEEKAGDDDDI